MELLTVIAHYHRTGRELGLAHTVNFGRPWLPGSACEFGVLSRPYLDGQELEFLELSAATTPVRCLWLVPITRDEATFAKQNGLDALEREFERADLDYLDPNRASVV